jgi:hypothetical protein
MLPNEPFIIVGRQGFADAQAALLGSLALNLGYFQAGWYGTNISDERGSFGIVGVSSLLAAFVGNVLSVQNASSSDSVYVYIHSTSISLDVDIALARRPYLAISRLDVDPLEVVVNVVDVAVVPA